MEREKNNKPIPNYLKNIKINAEFANADYMLYNKPQQSAVNPEKERIDQFKRRLDGFKKIKSLKEAKELLERTMPIKLDRTTFYIGKAKCVIINTNKELRICFDAPDEFISFDFR